MEPYYGRGKCVGVLSNTHPVHFSVIFLALLFFLVPFLSHAEFIESFDADIVVAEDSSFTVTESIAYVFTEPKHGIYRCIPTIHQERPESILKERFITIEVLSVHKDTESVPYVVQEENKTTCIKIGDPNATISGEHMYTLEYMVRGAISYPAYGGAELYWNVTGHEWEVGMKRVTASVSAREGILLRERACYRGVVGKEASCDVRDGEGKIYFSGGNFRAGEGLTIAQSLDRSKIVYDVRERFIDWLIEGIIGVLVLFVMSIVLYRYKTEFKTDAPIIPQYEPYPGAKPMYAGVLFDNELDPRDITAGIVYLAQKGYIKIKKIDTKVLFFFEVDDYEMTLLRPTSELTDTFEQQILSLIFREGSPVGTQVTLRSLKDDYEKLNDNSTILQTLNGALRKDLKDNGFSVGVDHSSLLSGVIILGIVSGVLFMQNVPIKVIILGIIGMIVSTALYERRRTRKGYEVLDHLKGFKDFLRVTDSERFIFHNAPEKNPEQFMEYLPFAIAFGVEKEWAKTFEGISVPSPDWYDGGNTGALSAISLSQSLGGFSSTFAATSGSSASSGGGSSGGGSGGGGGGSW